MYLNCLFGINIQLFYFSAHLVILLPGDCCLQHGMAHWLYDFRDHT